MNTSSTGIDDIMLLAIIGKIYSCIPKGEYIFGSSFLPLLPTVKLTLYLSSLLLFCDKRTCVTQMLFVSLLNLDLRVQTTHGFMAGVYSGLLKVIPHCDSSLCSRCFVSGKYQFIHHAILEE